MGKYYFNGVRPGFVESVHVELSYKAVVVAVSEILWQNNLLQCLYIFYDELFGIWCPGNYRVALRVLV